MKNEIETAPAMINPNPAPLPMLPMEPAGTVALRMERRKLAAVLRALAPVASNDPFRHLLHGVFFLHEKGKTFFCATDGRRLHLFTETESGFCPDGLNGFIPSDLIKRAFKSVLSPKLCKNRAFDTLEVRKANANPSRLAMQGGAVWIVAPEGFETGSEPAGNFPDFERVIPFDAFRVPAANGWSRFDLESARAAVARFDETLETAKADAMKLAAAHLTDSGCPPSDPRFNALFESAIKEIKGEIRKRGEIQEALLFMESVGGGRPFSALDLPFSAVAKGEGEVSRGQRIARKGERMTEGPDRERIMAVSKIYFEETLQAFDALSVCFMGAEVSLSSCQVETSNSYGPICLNWKLGRFANFSALIMPQKI